MSDVWSDVDSYAADALGLSDDADLEVVLNANHAAGLPPIDVSPLQGKFLQLLAQIRGARRILEIGTLGGYSTINLARALPDGGQLITLEYDPKHAEVAQANLQRAGVAGRVEIKVGPALDSLPTLKGPFDLVFVDADKVNNPEYFRWAVRLAAPGAVIVVDNVVRNGKVLDADSTDPAVVGTRGLFDAVAAEGVTATVLQTVGAKGYDGFLIATVA